MREILGREPAMPLPGTVMVGPGDDAAVWRPATGRDLVLTQDALVEGVDFRREWTTPYLVGRRALVLSLSDLAAMGADPAWCMASICAAPSTRLDDALAIHLGITEAATETGCRLVGGDISSIDGPLVVDVGAGGEVDAASVLRRDGGRPGDLLAVTGVLGRAAAGLRLLGGGTAGVSIDAQDAAVWRRAQLEPRARLAEGRRLAAAGVRCGGDLSDGLLVDARRTAVACGCRAELWLDQIPVDASLRRAFDDWAEIALGGGEDFELLVAAPEALVAAVRADWPRRLAPLSVVGRLVEGAGVRLLDSPGGVEQPLPAARSRHFG